MKENDEDICPPLLKPWISIYENVPPIIKFPLTNISITFTMLSSIYFLAVKKFIRQCIIPSHFPNNEDTNNINIYLTSISHSTVLCVPLFFLLTTQKFVPSAPMNKAPKWWQTSANAVLEFCCGYMLYDGLYNSVYEKYIPGVGFDIPIQDWCFLGHHLATTFYMTSTRINGAGHLSAMIIMFFGEITNPVQNSRSAIKVALAMGDCCSTPFMSENLYPIVDFLYALMYSIVRVGLNPYLNIRITYDFLCTKGGRERMALPLSLSLLFMLWGVTLGTIPWCLESVDIVKTYLMHFGSGLNKSVQDL